MANTSSDDASSRNAKKLKEDFEFLEVIGDGSFSTVYKAKDKKTGFIYAIKECNKRQIIKEKKTKYIHLEKRILLEFLNDHPLFVQLYCTFQDEDSLFFCLTYCSNGDLLTYMNKNKPFSLQKTQFYIAEITLALEYMHSKRIIHRDIKPENILLDDRKHIKLTDFGTARILDDENNTNSSSLSSAQATGSSSQETAAPTRKRNSFVGTAQYVAPEILHGKEPHIGSDLWSLGCIVYQMLAGKHLFSGSHEYDIFQKIVRLEFQFPENFSEDAKDLVKKLVVTNPEQRLGASEAQGYAQLKAHSFFSTINWSTLLEQEAP